MKSFILIFCILGIGKNVLAQTNTFPSSGNAGIGTSIPASDLHIKGNKAGAVSLTVENGTDNVDYTAANIMLKSNYGMSYRGLGMFMYDAPSNVEWYAGSPYAGNDRFIVSRAVLPAYPGGPTAQAGNALFTILNDGKVGIGAVNPDAKLTVAGNIHSREVKVTTAAGADFVFADDYHLLSLDATEKFIKANKHLPEIDSAEKMIKDGINLGAMNIKLLQKIEELTLHLIAQEKIIQTQRAINSEQQSGMKQLIKRIQSLEINVKAGKL